MQYPSVICATCGRTYGRKTCFVATWHYAQCDVCGQLAPVTEVRDFGYLKPEFTKTLAIKDDRLPL